jgi:hypothetical protein
VNPLRKRREARLLAEKRARQRLELIRVRSYCESAFSIADRPETLLSLLAAMDNIDLALASVAPDHATPPLIDYDQLLPGDQE